MRRSHLTNFHLEIMANQDIQVEILMSPDMTPSNFYVVKKSKMQEYFDFDAELQAFYKDQTPKPTYNKEGMMVVLYEKFFWRAVFVGMNDDLPKFHLVDEGRSVTLASFEDIRGITDHFVEKPAFCFRCHLWVLPTEDATEYFRQLCQEMHRDCFLLIRQSESEADDLKSNGKGFFSQMFVYVHMYLNCT